MTYSYSTPLTYGPQQNVVHYEGTTHTKPSALPATMGSLLVGGGIGAAIASCKTPYLTKSGEISDTFARTTFENYINRTAESGKEAYEGCLNILKKIDNIKNPEELKALMDANKEAGKEICNEMKQTPEEFLSNITKENLNENKKVIKDKITATNNSRYQNIKNQIQACWDKENKKFIKKDTVKEEVYQTIKNSTTKMKGKVIAKYAAIGAGIGGVLGFAATKLFNK